MTGGFISRMDAFARSILPLLSATLIVLVSATPLHLPFSAMTAPSLILMVVYYWTIYRPDLLNGFFILLLGLLQDLLIGGAFGITSFILLLTYLTIISQRRFFHSKSFTVVWWGFMLIALGAGLIAWITAIILSGRWVSPAAPAISTLLTILLYPVVAALLSQIHKFIPAQDEKA